MLSLTSLIVQVGLHMVRGTLPMRVLPELACRRFDDIPTIQDEHVTVTFTMAICHQIWMYRSGGRSLAELTVMPSVRPSAAVMRILESGTHMVGLPASLCQC